MKQRKKFRGDAAIKRSQFLPTFHIRIFNRLDVLQRTFTIGVDAHRTASVNAGIGSIGAQQAYTGRIEIGL
jgi:hypothetical protein